jgi:hypothetical protein
MQLSYHVPRAEEVGVGVRLEERPDDRLGLGTLSL